MSVLTNDSAVRAEGRSACNGAMKQRGGLPSRMGTSIEEIKQ